MQYISPIFNTLDGDEGEEIRIVFDVRNVISIIDNSVTIKTLSEETEEIDLEESNIDALIEQMEMYEEYVHTRDNCFDCKNE